MAQVTLYMDDETLARMRSAADGAGLSMSAWLTRLVRQRTARQWPAEVAAMAGAWTDLPTADELRTGQPTDIERETL